MTTRRCRVLVLAIGLTAVGCGAGEPEAPQRPDVLPNGPNVILISIDTLRADHLGAYGYERATSPTLDRLASEGVLFESHMSSTSWTLPAHAAMFSSYPDSVHGATDTDRRLSEQVVTLAERFWAAGYETAGFFAGPYLHPAFGLAQGFDHYINCTSYAAALDDSPVDSWAMNQDVMQQSHRDVTNPIVLDAVRDWLEGPRERRFFAFVHLWDTHFDFIPPAPYDRMFDPDYEGSITGEDFFFDDAVNADMPPRDLEHLIALYDGEIAWTDAHLQQLLDALAAAGELENTVIAITSDHGTEFFEHGNKGHRTTLFDELIHVPLVVWYPPDLPAGVRVAHQTRSIDIGPTLLELAGLEVPDVAGRSLLPLAHGAEPDFDNRAVSELFSVGQRVRTLRTPEWKLYDVLSLERRFWTDLVEDPAERALRPVGAGRGEELLAQYVEVTTAIEVMRRDLGLDGDASQVPDDVREQLESLGYIGRN